MFACAILVTAWLLMVLPPGAAHPASVWAVAAEAAERLVHNVQPAPEPGKPATAVPVFSARAPSKVIGHGVPGVIFRPQSKPVHPPALLLPGIAATPPAAVSGDIPFTGEYRLFRTSSHTVPAGALVLTGTPLDALYATTDGSTIVTEAYQPLSATVDFARFSAIELSLRTGGDSLAFASLQLVGAGPAGNLGPELFGLHRGSAQTVQFVIPQSARTLRATAIRVLFQSCDPNQLNTTVKVAIDLLTLRPNGY